MTDRYVELMLSEEPFPATAFADLQQLEVVHRPDRPAQARLRFSASWDETTATWPIVDDGLFQPGVRLQVNIGLGTQPSRCVLLGCVTGARLGVVDEVSRSFLEVDAEDVLWLLDRGERVRRFPGRTLHQIVAEIAADYGLLVEHDLPAWLSDTKRDPLVQRGTDYAFLHGLARRLGRQLYATGDALTGQATIHLRRASPGTADLAALAVHDECSSLREIDIHETAPRWLGVTAPAVNGVQRGWDSNHHGPTSTGSPTESSPRQALQTALRESTLSTEARRGVRLESLGGALADEVAQGQSEELDFVVEANGSVDTMRYEDVLMPHRSVEIRGVGLRYGGAYYVTHVEHQLDFGPRTGPVDYRVQFRAGRNRLGTPLTGSAALGTVMGLA